MVSILLCNLVFWLHAFRAPVFTAAALTLCMETSPLSLKRWISVKMWISETTMPGTRLKHANCVPSLLICAVDCFVRCMPFLCFLFVCPRLSICFEITCQKGQGETKRGKWFAEGGAEYVEKLEGLLQRSVFNLNHVHWCRGKGLSVCFRHIHVVMSVIFPLFFWWETNTYMQLKSDQNTCVQNHSVSQLNLFLNLGDCV